jgi:signal transduction histidine kinase
MQRGGGVECIRELFEAVFGNLLQNACKFTRPQTTVTLRVRSSAERVFIEVEDECRGLPAGNVNDLFLRFEQRSADRTGAGLGLAFSRCGVEADHGQIHARDLPGRGCIFTVDLQRLAVPADAMV